MKLLRRIISIFAMLCLLCAMLPAAFAAPAADTAPAEEKAAPTAEELFEGKSWDQVIEAFLLKHGIDHEGIALGYYNTVTGEEHYLRPDQYMVAASMYKVPLNMVFAERVYNGEMTWETELYTVPYQQILEETIINSNNNYAEVLWLNLGSYQQFRRDVAPYMGEDPDNVDWKYYENNFFTCRQMMHCMKLLYEESERFPKVLDTMKKAEPNNYFSLYEDRYEIAHKYGFLQEEFHFYMNDCAVVWTDDPIVIVMFTDNVNNTYEVMADYCTLMCDYTQYNSDKRRAAERLAEELRRQDEEAAAAATPEPSAIPIPQSEDESISGSALLAAAAVIAGVLLSMVLVVICRRKNKMSLIWAALAIVFAGVALLMCIFGSQVGTLIAKPEGNPQDTVNSFFESVTTGDYDTAYSHLKGYSSLGLEKSPADEIGVAAYKALQESYAYSLYGEASVDKLTAYQQVQFTYLDLPSIQSDVEALTMANLNEIVQTRSKAEVYDENNKYLPEVTQEAYSKAVNTVLSAPKKYYVTTGILVELEYSDGRWMIIPGNELLRALIGGTAY